MCGITVLILAAMIAVSAPAPNPAITASMPAQCTRSYCHDKSENYPQELIDQIVNESLGDTVEAGERIGDRNGGELVQSDCEAQPVFEPIYEIIDDDGNVRYVAQSPGKFEQRIKVVTCLNPGLIKKSRFLERGELDLYKFVCQERKTDFSFIVLSLDGTRLEDVYVKGGLPVCCSCMVEEEGLDL